MDHPDVDRRLTKRHNLKIVLYLRTWGSTEPQRKAKSFDISERGALLETDLAVGLNSLIEVQLKLPESITGQRTTRWDCRARVIHILPDDLQTSGQRVGVSFDWIDGSQSQRSSETRDRPYLRQRKDDPHFL
jgi:hypothetical protein